MWVLFTICLLIQKPWAGRQTVGWPKISLAQSEFSWYNSNNSSNLYICTWRRIEVVATSLTRNQVVRKGTWVRIPPSAPFDESARSWFVTGLFCTVRQPCPRLPQGKKPAEPRHAYKVCAEVQPVLCIRLLPEPLSRRLLPPPGHQRREYPG